jgi:hypothetical protein
MRRQRQALKRSPKTWVVYVKIAGHNEQVEMSDDMTDDEARELFVCAAEISSRHVLKLYTSGIPAAAAPHLRQHRREHAGYEIHAGNRVRLAEGRDDGRQAG